MALIDNLQTELEQVVALRLQLTRSPKPNYSLDGESYSWADYYRMLTEQQKTIEEMIQRASGPFELATRGHS